MRCNSCEFWVPGESGPNSSTRTSSTIMLSQLVVVLDLFPTTVQRWQYKYFVYGHYQWSCLYLKHHPDYFSKHNVSEAIFCPDLHVETYSTSVGPNR
jgi:hypothetical protein